MWLVSCGAFCFSDAGIVMWGCAAWQVYTRQKMGYDFARIGARQRRGGTPGQERHWDRAAAYFKGRTKFFLTFTNIYSIIQAGWNTAIEYLCSRFAYAEPMMVYHWDCPSTVRGLPSDRRNSACVVGILRCFCFARNWGNEYWRYEAVQLDKWIPARKWDTTLRG